MVECRRPCWMEVNLEAIERNYAEAVRRAGPRRNVIASIKGNAYGHGVAGVVSALDRQGAFAYWTGNIDEALALRRAGTDTKIIMFGGYLPSAIPMLIAQRLAPTIYEVAGATAASNAGNGNRVPVYVKVDAGLGRLGVPLAEAEDFIVKVAGMSHLAIEGIYTHLPFGDVAGKKWALECSEKFSELLDRVERRGVKPDITQLWGSSGLIADLPDRCNTVCIGHLLYGLSPVSSEVAELHDFQLALTAIKANLIHVGHHAAGTDLAIANDYRTHNAKVTGVLAVGTGDGMRRPVPGAKMEVLIRGRRAPVIGLSLEHTVLDLTGIDDPQVGEEVVLVGASQGDTISLTEWGTWAGTSALDAVLTFSGRLECRYVNPADNIWGRFAGGSPA
jgi:alanine racemase